jgi:hypothetical protein
VFNSAIGGVLTQTGGQTVIDGSGAVDQLTLQGGVCVYNTTGTLGGNTVVAGDGVFDFSQNPVTTQVTNAIDLYGTACRVLDPLGRVWEGTRRRRFWWTATKAPTRRRRWLGHQLSTESHGDGLTAR